MTARFYRWRVLAAALWILPLFARADDACAGLARMIDAAPPGPVFLASYPTAEPGPLHDAAFLYDNAAAVVALVGCGEKARAERIGQAILIALDNDRFWKDGRLRNAYKAGAAEKPAELPGWWDKAQNRWLEDRYQAGSDVGNMAWAMLALLSLDAPPYVRAADRIGTWVLQWEDKRGAGGFTGGALGHEPSPEIRRWKSTEHNTDLAAAFALLGMRGPAAKARRFVEAMWDETCACFAAGTGEDGVARNPTLSLDAQIWPLLAVPGAIGRAGPLFGTLQGRLAAGGGYAYGEARDGIWTEGTAQAALLREMLGHGAEAAALRAAVEAQRAPDGLYYATGAQSLPTGYGLESDPGKPRLYFRLPHLGATAWAALAERGFNPFTLKRL